MRRPDAIDDLQGLYGDRLHLFTLDLADTGGIRREVDGVFAAMDRVDVVFSNAGYGLFGAAEELTEAQISRQLATNLLGSIELIRASLPHLRRQGGGHIVQTSASGGQTASSGLSVYHASKWGIEGFIEALAQEVASFGIDTVIAEPGPTGAGFGANAEMARAIEAYDGTPVGQARKMLLAGRFPFMGDAGRNADAIIAAADAEQPERRLVLGSVAYTTVEQALSDRLQAVRNQKAAALAVDPPHDASVPRSTPNPGEPGARTGAP